MEFEKPSQELLDCIPLECLDYITVEGCKAFGSVIQSSHLEVSRNTSLGWSYESYSHSSTVSKESPFLSACWTRVAAPLSCSVSSR